MSDQIEPIDRMIAQMRMALGWTQQELADKVGVTRASIANMETGRQRMMLHTIILISEAFQTTPKHFLGNYILNSLGEVNV